MKFYKYDRPSINRCIINMAWAGKPGEIRESEMNNIKRHQPHVTKVTFYCSSNL